MKKISLILFILIGFNVLSQGKYEAGMTKALTDLKNAQTADDMLKISAFFERIADAEKDKWLPYYYAAFCNNASAWMNEKADKDKTAEKSLVLLDKAEILETNNSEIHCLRSMTATMQMTVDPMSRWQSYGTEASKALDNAKKADPNNPRIYHLEAQSKMNTPVAFGGGKKVAKPIFEKAVELYNSFTLASPFHPDWGKDDAVKLLKECD